MADRLDNGLMRLQHLPHDLPLPKRFVDQYNQAVNQMNDALDRMLIDIREDGDGIEIDDEAPGVKSIRVEGGGGGGGGSDGGDTTNITQNIQNIVNNQYFNTYITNKITQEINTYITENYNEIEVVTSVSCNADGSLSVETGTALSPVA